MVIWVIIACALILAILGALEHHYKLNEALVRLGRNKENRKDGSKDYIFVDPDQIGLERELGEEHSLVSESESEESEALFW